MMNVPVKKRAPAANGSVVLKGAAILAVLTIHVLASLPPSTFTTSPLRPYNVGLDQLARYAVPLFVMLSGYGFSKKYETQPFQLLQFLWSQAKKLLPWYVLASVTFWTVFQLIPRWKPIGVNPSLTHQLLTGQADYHLYFVPMIFQLYLLFPILKWLIKKNATLVLLSAALFQVWLYWLYSKITPPPLVDTYLKTDQQQYIWWFNWIYYFVLGMWLATQEWFKKHSALTQLLLLGGSVISWIILTTTTNASISSGVDPIIALRTSKVGVIVYASFVCCLLMIITQSIKTGIQKNSLYKALSFLGAVSYPIYLFHTLVLRVLFPR
jgi:probable poly-beta-1,6-N-acetyl-D-glucosamine export protein